MFTGNSTAEKTRLSFSKQKLLPQPSFMHTLGGAPDILMPTGMACQFLVLTCWILQ